MTDTSPETRGPGSFNHFEETHPDVPKEELISQYTAALTAYREVCVEAVSEAPGRTVVDYTVTSNN